MAEFPVATSNFENLRVGGPATANNDPASRLDGSPAAEKLRALRQHTADMRSLLPDSDVMNSLRADRSASLARLNRLRAPAQAGGFNIRNEEHVSVVDEKKKLAEIETELDRLTAIDAPRAEKWSAASAVLNAVEGWLRTGIPDGYLLAPVADPPLSEILKKGERIDDAIARLERRCRELAADRHRISSSPYPSAVAKQKAAEQINALADAAAPYCTGTLEFLDDVRFSEKQVTSTVYNIENARGAPVAISTQTDAVGLLCWLMRDVLIEKLHREIDQDADDQNALSAEQRAEQLSQIDADLLATEREVACLVWQMRRDGVEYRVQQNRARCDLGRRTCRG